ncbi:unnamed protein product [Eruca vesicaria subsp. sativa]|uniref:Uncharacterized protein n=1 Tax=Eruca vesicaria subsp. sativa TaxID=29727 RepID=A0ABC8JNB2_ERUVS|nr:unnamed protein product [Eruca vesicaria subsp. sativa]
MSNCLWFSTLDGVNYSIDATSRRIPNVSLKGLITVEAEIIGTELEFERLFYTFTIKEFIEEEKNALKEDLYYSLVIAGLASEDADMLISNMIMVAENIVFAGDYSRDNTLVIFVSALESLNNLNYNIQLQQTIQESINDVPPVMKPTSESAIASLEVNVVKDDDNLSEDKCVICLRNFFSGSEILVLSCG